MPSNNLSKEEISDFKEFAEKVATRAGKILLLHTKTAKVVKKKALQDIATTADIASENFIIDEIEKKYPTHSILAEESGEKPKNSPYKWIIDPLDGTKEFVRGIPLYNVSLTLEFKGELVAGALFRPAEGVLFSVGKGLGAYKNGVKIKVSGKTKLSESFVYCYIPSYVRNKIGYDEAFDKLKKLGKKVYRLRAMQDENTALSWLASGGLEAYVNLANPPLKHDIAFGLLIAHEAGAVVDTDTFPVVVANGKNIYNELSAILKR